MYSASRISYIQYIVFMYYMRLLAVVAVLAVVQPREPRQLLSDETQSNIKELFFTGASDLQPWRHVLARAYGQTQSVTRGLFPCRDAISYRSRTPPVSVHRVMPGDVDVVAALGDSLTAGLGGSAATNFGVFVEDRGLAWSIGGQGTWRDTLTLPNILLHFNPNLVGFSTGSGPSSEAQAGLNVAEPGALGRDMPFMARALVHRMRRDRRIDIDKHWKLVTMKIGHNDVCSEMCYLHRPEIIIDELRTGMLEALDFLRDSLPRTIVNVVPIIRIEEFPNEDLPSSCYTTNTVYCPCIFGPRFRRNKRKFSKIAAVIRQTFSDVALKGDYNRKADFAVILQPFTLNLTLPRLTTKTGESKPDLSFLSPDCFHFSQKGYARAANALWNNMLQPEGKKSTNWTPLMHPFLCPSQEHPYIFTAQNSPPQSAHKQDPITTG